MQSPRITEIPKSLKITLRGEKILLPSDLQNKVDRHWEKLLASNPHLHNGEVFTVTHVEQGESGISLELAETDYAHFLYSHQIGGLDRYGVRVIHSAGLVISDDNKFIFGSMGAHTSRAAVIQCCGGGIDHDDVQGRVVDIKHSIIKELNEELGIDVRDKKRVKALRPAFIKSGGPIGHFTVVYYVHLNQNSTDFLHDYGQFANGLKSSGELPEFDELFVLSATPNEVEKFIRSHKKRLNEYMEVALRRSLKDVH